MYVMRFVGRLIWRYVFCMFSFINIVIFFYLKMFLIIKLNDVFIDFLGKDIFN